MVQTLLSLGHGYSAAALARLLVPRGWRVIGTTRQAGRLDGIAMQGAQAVLWPGTDLAPLVAAATHLLTSVAPQADGTDPVLAALGPQVAARRWDWVGYLSTTGVYGDTGGAWVDEDAPLDAGQVRGRARVAAEAAWRATGVPLHIFRLAGIYGPGRGPFEKVRDGTARRIVKPGQYFSRIHVDDIAQVLAASIARPNPGAAYNVCDDAPVAPEEVLGHAAALLGLPPPPAVPYAEAAMTPMARSFYAESRRVRNDRVKDELGVRLLYPTYREGLAALLAAERAGQAAAVEIRTARTTADFAAAGRLIGELRRLDEAGCAARGFAADALDPLYRAASAGAMQAAYSQPDARLYLVLLDGRAVGCGGFVAVDGGTAEIRRLYVDGAARGQGIGARLMSAIMAETAARGLGTLRLETAGFLEDAIRLYRRHGFAECPPFRPITPGIDELSLFMQRPAA